MTRILFRLTRRFLADRSGIAATEGAMVMPMLLVIVLGTFDLGFATTSRMQLDHALRSGAQLAMLNTTDPNTVEGITLDALGAETAGSVAQDGICTANQTCVNVSVQCSCGSVVQSCSQICTASNRAPDAFLTIAAARRYEGIFLGDRPVASVITVQTR